MTARTQTSPLSVRPAPRPSTTSAGPHVQIDLPAPTSIENELWRRMSSLARVTTGRSGISAPSSKALLLDEEVAKGKREAFLVGTEFAHLHGDGSGSLHLALPRELARQAIEKGWADLHPAVRQGLMPPTLVMLYGPRDENELETVWALVQASYRFAQGPAS